VTDKTVTEREAVLRERAAAEAVLDAFKTAFARMEKGYRDWAKAAPLAWWPCHMRTHDIAKMFPLPKVTRPRVVRDREGWKWQCIDGRIQWSGPRGWRFADVMTYAVRVTPERVVLWADLLANPTEDVEDDDASR
jgi:hypothetical protein